LASALVEKFPWEKPFPNTTMRLSLLWIGIAALTALLSSGCRIPGHEGPVPQSLADCRRLSQQGVAALDRGDQSKAETLLAQAVTACPVDAEARRRYAESLWRRNARQEAIAQLESAGRLMGEDATLWTRLAEMHLACNQPELAWQDVEQALKYDSKMPGAWAIRGGVHRATGQPREALTDYLRALGYAPNDRAILQEIAALHRQLNQPERAMQTLQTLADTYSPGEEPGQIFYEMGLAYVALGRFDDGAASFTLAIKRGKPTAEMYCRLGEAELLAGRATEAAENARHALALQPQDPASRELLARIEVAMQPGGTVRK
jgi:tetratricopeptide (TPR) repeat protein